MRKLELKALLIQEMSTNEMKTQNGGRVTKEELDHARSQAAANFKYYGKDYLELLKQYKKQK